MRFSHLLSGLLGFIRDFFTRGDERTMKARKNILLLAVIKGCSIAVSLILVPITIHYVNPTRYGIWLTLSSIIGWFSFFDVGLGHGLRNKFAEAVTTGKDELARIFVSTTYAILGLALIVFGFFCLQFVLWLITTILTANQQPAKASVFDLLGSLFSLSVIYILTKTSTKNTHLQLNL